VKFPQHVDSAPRTPRIYLSARADQCSTLQTAAAADWLACSSGRSLYGTSPTRRMAFDGLA